MKNKTFGLALVAVALLPLRAFGLHHETPRYQMVSRKNPTDNAPPAATIPGLGDSSRPFSQGGLAAWCAFDSAADLKGQGAAFKGGRQVFLFDNNPDEGGRQVYQVTDEPGTSSNPSVTGTGSIVAFDSDAVLTSGNPGPVGVKQIYTWTRKTQLPVPTGSPKATYKSRVTPASIAASVIGFCCMR